MKERIGHPSPSSSHCCSCSPLPLLHLAVNTFTKTAANLSGVLSGAEGGNVRTHQTCTRCTCLYAGCSLQLAIPPLVAQLALSFAIVQFPPTFCEIGNVSIPPPRPLHDTTLQVRGCAPPRLPRVLAPAPGPAGGVAGAGGGLGPGPRPQRLAGVQPRLAAGTVQHSTVQYSTVQYSTVQYSTASPRSSRAQTSSPSAPPPAPSRWPGTSPTRTSASPSHSLCR